MISSFFRRLFSSGPQSLLFNQSHRHAWRMKRVTVLRRLRRLITQATRVAISYGRTIPVCVVMLAR